MYKQMIWNELFYIFALEEKNNCGNFSHIIMKKLRDVCSGFISLL